MLMNPSGSSGTRGSNGGTKGSAKENSDARTRDIIAREGAAGGAIEAVWLEPKYMHDQGAVRGPREGRRARRASATATAFRAYARRAAPPAVYAT